MINISNMLTLLRHVQLRSFEKGEVLIHAGSTKKDLFFLRKGLVRCYYTTEELEEITFQLYPEYHTVFNINLMVFGEPSKLTYQAIERTKVYAMDHEVLMELAAKNPKILEMNREVIGKKMMKLAYQRAESFVLLSAEQRYEKYVKDYPNIVNRAPDKYIANVLGITPVSLSRIRGRIAARKG